MGVFGKLKEAFKFREVTFEPGDYFIIPGPEHHQRACKKLAKLHKFDWPNEPGRTHGLKGLQADLIPQPTNEADPNAIQITIERQYMGYVPRDETARFHRQLDAAQASMGHADAEMYRGADNLWRVRVNA